MCTNDNDYESGTDQDTGKHTNWAGTDEDRARAKIRELQEDLKYQEARNGENNNSDWETHD